MYAQKSLHYQRFIVATWYKLLIILKLEYKRIMGQGAAYLIAFGIAWYITNGWAYTLLAIGSIVGIKWMTYIGSAYLAILWLPCTPEKVITIPIAIFLKKRLIERVFNKHRHKHLKKN